MIYAENIYISIAAPLCVALFFVTGMGRRMCLFILAGLTVCLLSAYVNGFLVGAAGMGFTDGAIFVTPISEEVAKLLPVLFYFLVFEPEGDELLMAAAMVGVGFASLENVTYLMGTGAESLSYTLIRGFATGVMHTTSTLAVGFGLAILPRCHRATFAGTLGLLAAAVTGHAVYNLLISAGGTVRMIGYFLPMLAALGLALAVWKRKRIKQAA